MAFAHSFPIDGAKPQDNDVSNKYPGPFPPEVAKAPFAHLAPSEQELVGNPMPTRLRRRRALWAACVAAKLQARRVSPQADVGTD